MKKLTFLAIAMIALAIAPLSLGAANPNKILIAYFSWGGNTETVANYIANQTHGELFRIEPVVPYPSDYTPCTEVALEERDTNARPAIKDKVANWDDYDVIFIGCPVWWHEAPMIIHTFAESYDFTGKTVVPFCTYAATYRDETLAKIVLRPSRSRSRENVYGLEIIILPHTEYGALSNATWLRIPLY
ncbi:MAG: hypothetical protein K2H14_00425 [Muribaculaceae bacterium]|nr:hypothetical protein [Muribaculaceae bacterium]